MPKTTKEVTEKKDNKLNSKTTSVSKKNSTSKAATTKSKSTAKSVSKVVNKKAASTSKKSKNAVSKKSTSNKKTPSKKQIKTVTKSNQKKSSTIDILEYYDLPYRYNETIVKILAQTPKTLFVYWDISDNDRENYIKQYGNDFFEKTKPVLIIHNVTMNYTFEIEINDFANCWYFNINDEKCEYSVELGRRPKEFTKNNLQVPNNYLYITSSNKIESPNGHILFEKDQKVVFYKDVKTNKTFSKDIANVEFMKYLGKAYNTYDMYKKIYTDEQILNINNPTSSFK